MNNIQSDVQEVSYDQYKIWKRNSLVLYDLCVTHVLFFPSLTIDFQLLAKTVPNKFQALVGFAIGTNSPNIAAREPNYMLVKQLVLPSVFTPQPADTISASSEGILAGGYNILSNNEQYGRLIDLYQLKQESEPNCIAFCPLDTDLVAVLTDSSLRLFDLQSALMKTPNDSPAFFDFQDDDGGFCLCFSGSILVHGGSSAIRVFDVKQRQKIAEVRIDSIINQVVFSPFYKDTIAAVTDDGELLLIDALRGIVLKRELLGNIIQNFTPTSIAFSQFNEKIIALASDQGVVVIFDISTFKIILQKQIHQKAIFQLKFSPFYENLLMTGSEDSKIILSNAFNLDQYFVHQGHTMAISDCKFHPLIPNLIGSVAEDNSLQFWWPTEGAFK
ncbi:Histone_acetyltransferase type B subunit 2 [Hexamita inflata]|uniref:Histone acetyltransferase type B subunit 2 n=1 Tax=Hexamita inflata TaxID=28002 RepID=A0AA86UGE3_9EUKA|nr:Histone acetyltransferase type B subunit 2 [Hexamita inflata]